jgi:multidrug efflux pump subunit AcrA (membrane-fusion protein)
MRRGVFPNHDGKLLPGLFARIRLPIGKPEAGLMVPDRAIATDQRGEYVLVVNDKKTVEYRPVKLGMRIAEMREVLSGIAATDLVIVNGIQRARPGAEVKPETATAGPDANSLEAANDPALATPSASRIANKPRPAAAAGGN